jgi:hypothetical protein
MHSSPFLYPEGSHQLKEMEDDASFLVSTYVVRILFCAGSVLRIDNYVLFRCT